MISLVLAICLLGAGGMTGAVSTTNLPASKMSSVDDILKINQRLSSEGSGNGEIFEGDILMQKSPTVFSPDFIKWIKKGDKVIIPYVLDPSYQPQHIQVINAAFDDLHATTCIRFVNHTGQRDYISIMPGLGCYSSIGRRGKMQVLSLNFDCLAKGKGIVLHELLHVIGFWHEHSRADRDDYVTIYWDAIKAGYRQNFCKYETTNMIGNYSLGSILHYSGNAFADKEDRPTIVPRVNASIGQREKLDNADIQRVNDLYCKEEHVFPVSPPQIFPCDPETTKQNDEIKIGPTPITVSTSRQESRFISTSSYSATEEPAYTSASNSLVTQKLEFPPITDFSTNYKPDLNSAARSFSTPNEFDPSPATHSSVTEEPEIRIALVSSTTQELDLGLALISSKSQEHDLSLVLNSSNTQEHDLSLVLNSSDTQEHDLSLVLNSSDTQEHDLSLALNSSTTEEPNCSSAPTFSDSHKPKHNPVSTTMDSQKLEFSSHKIGFIFNLVAALVARQKAAQNRSQKYSEKPSFEPTASIGLKVDVLNTLNPTVQTSGNLTHDSPIVSTTAGMFQLKEKIKELLSTSIKTNKNVDSGLFLSLERVNVATTQKTGHANLGKSTMETKSAINTSETTTILGNLSRPGSQISIAATKFKENTDSKKSESSFIFLRTGIPEQAINDNWHSGNKDGVGLSDGHLRTDLKILGKRSLSESGETTAGFLKASPQMKSSVLKSLHGIFSHARPSIVTIKPESLCGFEAGICGWRQSTDDDLDWSLALGSVSPSTGRFKAGGLHLSLKSHQRKLIPAQRARLVSPITQPVNCFSLWYGYQHSNVGSLNIYIISDNGPKTLLWSAGGQKRRRWTKAQIDLQQLPGYHNMQISINVIF
ncbi:astacin-like metalloendopeptidase [Pyxicephalus adspersus]|uniref:astacin-like metalloendopeptidase n=1 Tax=Pyxicephalus adspersus TaxID=30357 RepID=UPI003B5C8366